MRALPQICGLLFWLVALLVINESASGQTLEGVSIETAMQLRPCQEDVECDFPNLGSIVLRKMVVPHPNLVVMDNSGQAVRRLVDNNHDQVIDQWSFYRNGLEVYREIDSDFNHQKDQFRWFNFGNTRWGFDADEDGKIDAWAEISAVEASKIIVKALATQDARLLKTVLITQNDINALGIEQSLGNKLLSAVADPEDHLRKLVSRSDFIHKDTQWKSFSALSPSLIPADSIGANSDLTIYRNAIAMVAGSKLRSDSAIIIGELVRVGRSWKSISLPSIVGGNPEPQADLIRGWQLRSQSSNAFVESFADFFRENNDNGVYFGDFEPFSVRHSEVSLETISDETGIEFPILLSNRSTEAERRISQHIAERLSGYNVSYVLPSGKHPLQLRIEDRPVPPDIGEEIAQKLKMAFGASTSVSYSTHRELKSTPAWAYRGIARELKPELLTKNGQCNVNSIWSSIINVIERVDNTAIDLKSQQVDIFFRDPPKDTLFEYSVKSHWRVIATDDKSFQGSVVSTQVVIEMKCPKPTNSIQIGVESTMKIRKRDSRKEYPLDRKYVRLFMTSKESTGDFDEDQYGIPIVNALLLEHRPSSEKKGTDE